MSCSIVKKRNCIIVLLAMVFALAFGMFSAHAESLPKKGQSFHGTATVLSTNTDYSNTGKSTAVFQNHGNNPFAKHVKKYKVGCLTPGVFDPKKGETFNYTATVTSVNYTTGKVSGTCKYTPAGSLKGWRQSMGTKHFPKWSYTIPQNIKITMKKESSNPSYTKGNSYYSLKGTVFGVYAKKDKNGNLSSKKGELKVNDNSGNSNTLSLPKGTYYAKELTAGKGYEKKDEKRKSGRIYTIKATKASSKPYSFTAKNCAGNDPVAVQIEKIDARSNKPVETQPGALDGAKFQLSYYGDSTSNKLKKYWVFATKDAEIRINSREYKKYFVSGDAFFTDENKNVCFPYGKYTVKEIEAPKGFSKDEKTYSLTLSPNSNASGAIHSVAKINIPEKEARGDISFLKVSEKQKEKVLCQTCEEDITDASEEARTEKHGKNYYCSECGIEKTATHNKEDIEKHIQEKHPKVGGVKASYDKEKGITLSWDAVDSVDSYEIYYSVDDKNYQKIGTSDKAEYTDTGYERTEGTDSYYKVRAVGKTAGQYSDFSKINAYDEIQKDSSESTEPKDPTEGSDVSKDDEKESTEKDAVSKVSTQSEDNDSDSKDTVKDEKPSSDTKDDAEEKDTKDEEETPIIHDRDKAAPLTDISVKEEPSVRIRKTVYPDKFVRNNLANVSFTLTNTDTNESHTITTDSDGKYASKSDDSLWFGKAEDKKAGVGKLTAGNYTITEIKSDANKGLKMIDPVFFVIAKDSQVIDLGTLIDPGNLLYTTATSTDTGDHIAYGDGPISIKDKVEYKGVTVGKEYTVTGTLMDKSTGKEFLDKDGKKIIATEKFTATSEEGVVELTFTFDGTKIAKGHKLVAFERMDEEDTLFGVHESIDDKDQTVVFPTVETTALGNDTKMNLVSGIGNQTIIDTVSYDNVLSGKEYTLKGWLVTKDGKKINGSDTEKKFTASEEKGSESMYLTFDASKYAGEDVIVYEELYYNGKLVADHKDTSANSQTVHVSKVGTKAVNKETKVNVITKTGEQNITDTVSYDNLIPGKTYTMKGWLLNPDNGEALEDTTVTQEFTPEKSSGTVDMKLKFTQDKNTPLSKVVVFEELTIKNEDSKVTVGEHKDLTDTNQTLNTVEIGTTAVASDSKTNETSSVNNSEKEDEPHKNIVDTIHYGGLTPGTKYVAKGWLVDDEGNRIEDGLGGVTDFTPEKSSGDVDVLLSFDATKHAGDDIHVYEEVYVDGILIGEHKDKDDEGQTIHVSSVDTIAVGTKTDINQVGSKGKQEINDSVNYSNLDNTKTYTLKSWAVDKETGEKIEGSESEKTFVPKKAESEEAPDLDESKDNNSETTTGGKEEAKENPDSPDNKNTEDTVSTQSEENNEAVDSEDGDASDKNDSDNENAGKDNSSDDSKSDEETPSTGDEEKVQGERVSGTEMTTLSVDGEKVKGKILVVFQEVYDENGHLIGEHKDLDAESQTIYVPEIGTKASLGKLSNLLTGSGKKTVYDTIKYKNLVRDQFYEVTSYLVDKNGKKISGTDTKTTFSPKKADGEVTVKMTVDTDKLKGDTKLVAFEEIRLKGEFMAEHKDVHDKEQTVTITTPPTPPSTGDMKKMLPWLILAIVLVGAGGTYYYKKREHSK